MVEPNAGQALPPPNGFLSAKVDEKGRLKLPAKLEEYFISLGVRTLFITSLDRNTVRVYTPPAWQQTRIFLAENKDDPDTAADILFAANDVGGDSDMDAQGRVLIPQKLRTLLSLENQSVEMECFPGMIDVYTQARYEARLGSAVGGLAEKFRSMRQKGLK